ncbi:MAG: hypothetical protein AAF533_08775 [Acidobacteriota bacterium]
MNRLSSTCSPSVSVLALTAWLFSTSMPSACQGPPWPPGSGASLACDVMLSSSRVTPGDTVEITLTVTNFGDPFLEPPHRTDDAFVLINVDVRLGIHWVLDQPYQCQSFRESRRLFNEYWEVTLDDATSPHADGPVTWTETIEITLPEDVEDGEFFYVDFSASSPSLDCCDMRRCLPVEEGSSETPNATFVQPLGMGASGSSVPFVIEVERNGWEPGRPLRLVVERENARDPVDLFPIAPAELTEGGVEILGESARVEMSCGLHFPCFVGMANRLHLELRDGDDVLWASRLTAPEGSGEACVAEATLAHFELLSIDGGPPTRPLTRFSDHEVVVRGLLRNPAIGARLEEPSMVFTLPEGVELLGHELYHHDNPLDDHLPAPSELRVDGGELVVGPSGRVTATAPWLEHRFIVNRTGPAVFVDLFEAELRLRVPAEVLVRAGEALVLPGVEARAVLGGCVRERVTDALHVPIVDGSELEPPRVGLPGAPRVPNVQPGLVRRSDRR